jgi:hypothetical protein
MGMNQSKLQRVFERLLDRLGVRGKKVSIKKMSGDERVSDFAAVTINNGAVTLQYTNFIRGCGDEVVEAVLIHEACHVATLPDELLPWRPFTDATAYEAWVNFYRCFCEYIANRCYEKCFHEEFYGPYARLSRKVSDSPMVSDYTEQAIERYSNLVRDPASFTANSRFMLFADLFLQLDFVYIAYATGNNLFTKRLQRSFPEFVLYYEGLIDLFQSVDDERCSWSEKEERLLHFFWDATDPSVVSRWPKAA